MSILAPPPPPTMDAQGAIAALIDGARQVDFGASSGRDLLGVVGQLGQLRHIVDHLTSQAVRKVDRSGAWVEQGARNPQASVRRGRLLRRGRTFRHALIGPSSDY